MNPYTPPASDVRDRQPERLVAQRPRQVVHAVRLLWVSLALALPSIHLEQQRAASESSLGIWIAAAVVLALIAFVIVRIWHGANWARIVILALSVLSLVAIALDFDQLLQYSAWKLALEAVAAAIDVAIVYLLFTRPGSLWFARVPR